MNWKIYHGLAEFNSLHLYEVLKLRQDIFIIEQRCIYDDIDGLDYHSDHLLLFKNKDLVGYLRIVPEGKKFEEISLGRIVIHQNFRGEGYGERLVKKGRQIAAGKKTGAVRIEAQSQLEDFYEKLGFQTVSDSYDVDGIPHLQMLSDG